MPITYQPILLQGAAGQILGNIGSSLSYLKYGIYVVPVIVVIAIIFLLYQRKKATSGGSNIAIIYSLKHNFISEIKPFTVTRVLDKDKNIEETRALFTDTAKAKQGGIIQFFRGVLMRQSPQDVQEEVGAIFSEALATYNRARQGWLAVYTLETNTQLPLVTNRTDFIKKIDEMERNVERRVARLKSAQLAITNYVKNATPVQQLSQIQLVSFVLIFIAIIALAYAISSLGNSVQTTAAVMKDVGAVLKNATAIINITRGGH